MTVLQKLRPNLKYDLADSLEPRQLRVSAAVYNRFRLILAWIRRVIF